MTDHSPYDDDDHDPWDDDDHDLIHPWEHDDCPDCQHRAERLEHQRGNR